MIISDEGLVKQIAAGNQAAFEAFVHRYHGQLLNFLERMLKDSGRAEDFVQETFIKFIRQLKNKGAPENPKAWIYRVASNLCRDYWRSAGYRKEKQVLEILPETHDSDPSVVEIYEKQETRTEILQVLDQLPETQREIVILRFYHDMKLREIAEIVDCPSGTVKSRLFHALKYLKKELHTGKEAPLYEQTIR